MVGAILAEGAIRARRVEATADPLRGEHKELGSRVPRPPMRRGHHLYFGRDLKVSQADRGIGVRAGAWRKRIGVDRRSGEGRRVLDVARTIVVLGVTVVHVARLAVVGVYVVEVALDQALVLRADRVAGRHPEDRVDLVRPFDRTSVIGQGSGPQQWRRRRNRAGGRLDSQEATRPGRERNAPAQAVGLRGRAHSEPEQHAQHREHGREPNQQPRETP